MLFLLSPDPFTPVSRIHRFAKFMDDAFQLHDMSPIRRSTRRTRSQKRFPLLQLPYEIRCMIYEHIFASIPSRPAALLRLPTVNRPPGQDAVDEIMDYFKHWGRCHDVEFMRACKSIRDEALDVLFKFTKFVGPTGLDAKLIKSILSPFINRQYIKNIRYLKLYFIATPRILESDTDRELFKAQCTQWAQHLPALQDVDITVKLLFDSHKEKDETAAVRKIERFISKGVAPFEHVEGLSLDDGMAETLKPYDETKVLSRRALQAARDTIKIKRMMAINRKGFDVRPGRQADLVIRHPTYPKQ